MSEDTSIISAEDKLYENAYDMFDDNIKFIFELFHFDFNDRITRSEISAKMRWYLDTLKTNGKLFSYVVVIDESNNTPDIIDAGSAILDVRIQVKEQDTNYYSRRFSFDVSGVKITTL